MISFNNIPTTTRTPGVYVEVDNSRALKGLSANPHKALIFGQKTSAGIATVEALYAVTKEAVADSYFGAGSMLSRMCKTFKKNNPNTELYAVALSNNVAGATASARLHFSVALSHAAGIVSTNNETYNLFINGSKVYFNLTSGWSGVDVASAAKTAVNANSYLPVVASVAGTILVLSAVHPGEAGNNITIMNNYYQGESNPTCFRDSVVFSAMAGGANNPEIDDLWAVIENEHFNYIINPYTDAANQALLDTELAERFKPLIDKQAIAFDCYKGAQASCTTFGNLRNSPHKCTIGQYNSPSAPEEWAAAWGAVAAFNLNNDPARPIHMLSLKNILPPLSNDRFTTTERETLLYDGIATWIVDSSGNVVIERSITNYQKNSLSLADESYLDVETLATIAEIRYQYKVRMTNRFIIPRFKIADNSFPVQPGSYVATPATIKQEIISLFTLLRDKGIIENLDDFIENLVVERNASDVNRVDVLLPPDLINQFRVMAGLIQFIL